LNRGQTSVEALIILATVLIVSTSILSMTVRSSETDIAVSSAREGVQTSISRLSAQYGVDITIERWNLQGDNINFWISVNGSPPPTDNTIVDEVEGSASERVNSAVDGGYVVNVENINRVKR